VDVREGRRGEAAGRLDGGEDGRGGGERLAGAGGRIGPWPLVQTAEGPTRLFNLCLADGTTFRDGELTVQVRAVSGEIDQGGGLVWRAKDANNYYVCRYNPLEKNFRLYHVKAGQRKELAGKNKVELPAGKWFTVSVTHLGDTIRCTLNGEHALEVTDDTFPEAGQVGFWTKADAVTAFDELRMRGVGK
jgi:hypothetical protein